MEYYEANEKRYILKYNLGRLEMIERAVGRGTMNILTQSQGMLSIGELLSYLTYGLKEEAADAFMEPKKARTLAEQLVTEKGYAATLEWTIGAVERDCGFLFHVG